MDRRAIPGLVLIVIGAVLLLTRQHLIRGDLTVLLIGTLFLAGYAMWWIAFEAGYGKAGGGRWSRAGSSLPSASCRPPGLAAHCRPSPPGGRRS